MEKKNTKKIISIVIFAVGCVVLLAGIIAGVVRIVTTPGMRDAEYLVEVGKWTLTDDSNCTGDETGETNCMGGSGVIWNFTEIGKGTLTTNNHVNDYEFLWAIEGKTLKIETNWLYTLNDEYEYKLDQGAGVLTLKSGEKEIEFVKVAEENATTE